LRLQQNPQSGGLSVFLVALSVGCRIRRNLIEPLRPEGPEEIRLVRNLSDLYIQVSDRAHGTHGFTEWLGAYHGKTLQPPQCTSYYPEPTFVAWHVREVFQGEARYSRNVT